MKPEMERLLQLFDQVQQSAEHEQLFESELEKLHTQYSALSREQLRRVVRTAYLRWLKANQKPPTIPPSA